MSIAASFLFSAALALHPDADLRIYNPYDAAVDATLTCAGAERVLHIEPSGFADVADASQCTAIDSKLPLTAFETRGHDVQRVIEGDAECGDTTMYAPLFGCKAGRGTAAVPVVNGATYTWSAEGASVVEGASTPRVTLSFGQSGNVKLTCVITTSECSSTASGVIAVRDPISIPQFNLPSSADADTPVTITWSYGATSPTSQLLTGDAFEAPVPLPADARSYVFTPKRTGSRNVQLQASYFVSVPDAKQPSRRRAAGRSVATATDCAGASTTRTIEVKGCNRVEPTITAPESVDAGVTFETRVVLEDGEEAQWSVENGAIVAEYARDGRATIRAGESGDVRVNVSVIRGTCTRAAAASLRVIPAAKQCAVSPVATLTLISRDCSRAVVKAVFTGTPPFSGVWSDGTPFNTSASTREHELSAPGTYGITGFRDASCIGVVSGAPHVEQFKPRVKLEVIDGACTTGRLVAKLTGTPPFTFLWSNASAGDTWVTTNQYEIVREIESDEIGMWQILSLSDAVCREPSDSNKVEIRKAPFAEVSDGPYCQYDASQPREIWGSAWGGTSPYIVTWSDGVVTQTNNGIFKRWVPTPTVPLQEYTIASVTSGGCLAELVNAKTAVTYRPTPRINKYSFDSLLCPGEIGTATLSNLPAPGGTVTWSVSGGEILSGQCTSTITYRGTGVMDGFVRSSGSYPDAHCTSFDEVAVRFNGLSDVTDLRMQPATIHKGEAATLLFTVDRSIHIGPISTDPPQRVDHLGPVSCANGVCQATFRDAIGPGTVKFELQFSGDCMSGSRSVSTTLTITD